MRPLAGVVSGICTLEPHTGSSVGPAGNGRSFQPASLPRKCGVKGPASYFRGLAPIGAGYFNRRIDALIAKLC